MAATLLICAVDEDEVILPWLMVDQWLIRDKYVLFLFEVPIQDVKVVSIVLEFLPYVGRLLVGTQIPMILLITCLKRRDQLPQIGTNLCVSRMAKQIVVLMEVDKVPIALPRSSRKNMSPYSNMVFLITWIIASLTASSGQSYNRQLSRLSSKMLIT